MNLRIKKSRDTLRHVVGKLQAVEGHITRMCKQHSVLGEAADHRGRGYGGAGSISPHAVDKRAAA